MTLPALTMSKFVVSRKRLAFLCTGILVLAVAILFSWAGRQGLFAMSANQQRFTELYITKSSAIPVRLTAGQAYEVPFTLVNHEGSTRTFRYQIVVIEAGQTKAQPWRSIRLEDGAKAQRSIQFTAVQSNEALTAIVRLQDPKQQITFRVGQ